MSYKDLYSEVYKRKMEALNKKDVVKAVEKNGKILAFRGRFEKPDKIIRNIYAAEKRTLKASEIMKYDLGLYDIVLIGCPGDHIPEKAHTRIKVFVENGGWIITTDWAIVTIVEKIFPGYIRWNGQKTGDAVVVCQIIDPYHPFMEGVTSEITRDKWKMKASKNTGDNEFRWWLETKSYPIQILNRGAVHVLISSNELKYKWGEETVLCYFDVGMNGGRVIHLISHVELQKGGDKGKYASALILTNILDEKVSQRMGLAKGTESKYVSNWDQPQAQPQWTTPQPGYSQPAQDDWLSPPPAGDYVTPSAVGSGESFGGTGGNGLTGTSQIIEADRDNFTLTNKCVYCEFDFTGTPGKILLCKECKASYHENCLNNQINEGVCKNCNRILLW